MFNTEFPESMLAREVCFTSHKAGLTEHRSKNRYKPILSFRSLRKKIKNTTFFSGFRDKRNRFDD